ncbi:MAG: MATE family efflux transporter [Oceanicoccus sp.]
MNKTNEPVVAKASSPLRPTATDFTKGPVHKHLVRLTLFMVLGLVSVLGASLVETIYIGRVGTVDLAALGFTFPLAMIFQGVSMGLGIGASSVVARAMGSGQSENAKKIITHSLVLMMILIILFIALVYRNTDAIFSFLGANEEANALAVAYMDIWLLGLPFFTFAMVGSHLMRATSDPATPAYLMMIGSALHVLIAPIFIFGLFGAPKLGLVGAAWGFLMARLVSLLMYSYVIAVRDKLMIFSMDGFTSSCRDILHVGLPAIASNSIAPLSMALITKLIAGHGVAVVAGFSVAARIEQMILMVLFALANSIAPFIGQNWGAALFERVQLTLKLANGFVVVWGIAAYIFLYFSAEMIVGAINSDPAVVEAATFYLRIAPLAMAFMGFILNTTSCFNALGKPMPPLIISILQMIIIYLPLAMLGDHFWGYRGIFAAAAVTIFIVGIISRIWIRRALDHGIARRMKIQETGFSDLQTDKVK